MTTKRALIVGCGNIGALYDLERPGILTHAKALAALEVPFDIVEQDAERAARVAKVYGGETFSSLDEVDLAHYDIVSVASPTAAHSAQLHRLLAANVPLVVCEKPIATTRPELESLRNAYDRSRSVVLVNYIRRFQPAYVALAEMLARSSPDPFEGAQGFVVRYQRGFLNNASHAFDLLSFLLGRSLEIESLAVQSIKHDAFADDPTLSLAFRWHDVPVYVLGYVESQYPVFEIHMELAESRVALTDRGDRIDRYHVPSAGVVGESLVRDETHSVVGAINDYMLPVLRHGLSLLTAAAQGSLARGNFVDACALNLKLCEVLEKLTPTS